MNAMTRAALRTALAARGALDCLNAAIDLDTALQADPDPACAKAAKALNAHEHPADAIRAAANVLAEEK